MLSILAKSEQFTGVLSRSQGNISKYIEIYPLKSKTGKTLNDKNKKLERLVEHYVDLYSTANTLSEDALYSIGHFPILNSMDSNPTTKEVSNAIDSFKCGKTQVKMEYPQRLSNTYLGSTISSNVSIDSEISRRIAKAAGLMAQLSKRVWENNKMTQNESIRATSGLFSTEVSLGQCMHTKRTA